MGKRGMEEKWEIQLDALRSLPLRSLLPLRSHHSHSHSHSHQTIATCARAGARYLVPSPSLYLVRESRRLKIPANLYMRFTRWRASTIYTSLTAQAAKISTNSMLKVPPNIAGCQCLMLLLKRLYPLGTLCTRGYCTESFLLRIITHAITPLTDPIQVLYRRGYMMLHTDCLRGIYIRLTSCNSVLIITFRLYVRVTPTYMLNVFSHG